MLHGCDFELGSHFHFCSLLFRLLSEFFNGFVSVVCVDDVQLDPSPAEFTAFAVVIVVVVSCARQSLVPPAPSLLLTLL